MRSRSGASPRSGERPDIGPRAPTIARSDQEPRVLLRLHDHLGLDRVGDEATVMGALLKLPQFLGAGRPLAAEADLGAQGHLRHGRISGRVLPQDADRLIPVAVHHVPLLGGEGQEGQHLAAGEAGDERLLGIDAPGVAPITGGAEARTVRPPSKVQSWSRLYVSEVNSAVSRFHATVTVCSDMAFPPNEMIGYHRSRPDSPRLPAEGP